MCPAYALNPLPRLLHPHADNSGKISLAELVARRVAAVELAMKEDAEVFAENLVDGGLAVVAVRNPLERNPLEPP